MTIYIHKGDIGTIFELTIVDTADVVINVSTASIKYIYLQKPDGTKVRKTAAFVTDGTDGKIKYTAVAGDLNQVGDWQIQGYVETSDGKFFTRKTKFEVLPTLYVAS
jgi:hypothetical protein